MAKKSKTLIGLHLAVLLAGATGLFGRFISLAGLPLVWYRIMACIITLLVVMATMSHLHRISFKAFLKIAGCGVFLALHWVAFYSSIKAANVSIGVVCIATSCFFTAIFNPIVNKKRFSFLEIFISFITIVGTILIFSLDVRYRLGIILGLSSAALYSLFSLFNINVAKETGENSDTMLLYELIGGLLFLTLIMPVYVHFNSSEAITPNIQDIVAIAILAPCFTVIPFLLQLHALRHLSAFTVNVSYNLEPIYSIFLADLFFGEVSDLNFSFWAGLTLIVSSVIIQIFRSTRNETS